MKVALDTNFLVYAHGVGDTDRVKAAIVLLPRLTGHLFVSTQVIGELFNVLSRKARFSKTVVLRSIADLEAVAEVAGAGHDVMRRALHLALDHNFQIWDAFIVEAAVEAGCDILLSEDMQHGFFWNGLTILNPFLDPPYPLLVEALEVASRS
jgi:predicted nucleic acid-binding protein